MKIDRELQKNLLTTLAGSYPATCHDLRPAGQTKEDADKYTANLLYLQEHGLVHSGLQQSLGGSWIDGGAKITAAGIDFIADDGGLSAILGVVTVKLHDDTLRHLVEARIQSSDLNQEEKTGLLHQLRELRGESIKHLTMKLLDAGLENWPAALAAIQTSLRGSL